jgi:hypothetical protein
MSKESVLRIAAPGLAFLLPNGGTTRVVGSGGTFAFEQLLAVPGQQQLVLKLMSPQPQIGALNQRAHHECGTSAK